MKKHISLPSLFIFILLIGAVITAFTLWNDVKSLKSENGRLRSDMVRTANTIEDKYIDRVDSVPHTVFRDRVVTRNELKNGQVAISQGLLDTMVMALKMADGKESEFNKKIRDLTRIKGTLEGTIQGLRGDPSKGVLVNFNSPYLNGRVDTTFKVHYRYDAELRVAAYEEQSGFLGMGKTNHYVDISSPDSNFTINSVDRFRVDIPVKRKRWGVGPIAGWTVDPSGDGEGLKLRPTIGVGVSYDLIRF